MDFEEELDAFSLRNPLRKNEAGAVAPAKPVGHKYLPLLLRDLKRATVVQDVCFVFDGTIPVRSVVIYGRITSRLPSSQDFYVYMIDDGTERSEVRMHRHQTELCEIARLQNELDVMAARAPLPSDLGMVQCLRRLLSATQTSLDGACLAVGSKVLVYGLPSLYRNRITLNAISWASDVGLDRDREIEFKDNLLDWYANKYPTMRANSPRQAK